MLYSAQILILILISALTLWIPASAQSRDVSGPAPLVLTDDQAEYHLGPHMEILEDPTGNLTIQDVSSSDYSDRFVPGQDEAPNFGYTDSAYWVRYRLRNESQATDYWLLEVGFANMDYVDLYSPDGQAYIARQTGVLKPFKTRDIAYHHIVLDLRLQFQEELTFYMRFLNGASMTLPLTLWLPSAFLQASAKEQLLLGMFYGVLLIILVHNLFMVSSLREASYLYFVCFLASGILLFASYDALAVQYLWPDQNAWNRFSEPLFFILFMASVMKFTDAFLDTRTRKPKFHRLIMFMLVGWATLFLLVPFVSYRIIASLSVSWGIITLGVVGVAGIASWRAGYRSARLFLFSWIGLIVGMSLDLLVRLGVVPSTAFTEQFFRLGIIWLVALWAIALADRINLLEAEKEKVKLELHTSEARYRRLVETMNDGLGVVDEGGRFIYANDRLGEMLGFSIEEIISHPATDFLDLTNQQILMDQIRIRRTGINTPYELAWLRKDGSELFTIVSPMPLFEDDQRYTGSFAVITDITERVLAGRNLEQRVGERTRELATLLEVSHDIIATQELDFILNRILERLKTIVDYGGSAIFAEKGGHWGILAQYWPSLSAESNDIELSPLEVQALVRDFEHREPILIRNSNLDEANIIGFRTLAIRLSRKCIPNTVCWLGVPLLEKGSLIGALILGYEQADAYSEDQVKIAVAFANQISIAIENDRLYQQVRESGAVEERNRLARDLHDSVTQVLFSASLVAELLPLRIRRNPKSALQSAAELHRLTRGALAEMRTMLLELRPAAITKTPLGELLSQLTEAITSRTELPFQLYIDNLPPLPADVQTTFYHIAQETLNNVVKHAQAGQVIVSLSATPPIGSRFADGWEGEIRLVVRDDGIGYTLGGQNKEHLGLGIMQERAASINASVNIESQPGQGTAVTLIWHNQEGGQDG
jgi:PAS domain S-box-containing protein